MLCGGWVVGGEVWELHAQCWASLLWSPGLGWPQLAAPWSQWQHGAGPANTTLHCSAAGNTGNTAQQPATETPAWDTGHPGQPLVASRHPVHQPRHAGEGHLPGSQQFKVQASHSFPFIISNRDN